MHSDQPSPSRNSPTPIAQRRALAARCRTSSSDEQQHGRRRPSAPAGGRTGPRPSPTTGARKNIPSTCTLITMPITSSVAPAVVHVQRRHHHHRDHHRVRERQGGDAGGDARDARGPPAQHPATTTSACAPRRPPRASAASRATSSGSGRSSTASDQRRGEDRRRGRTRNGPVSRGRPRSCADPPGGTGEVRAGDRADRGRPDHDGQRTRPVVGPGQVGGGVARLAVGRGRGAEQGGADQQQREGVDDAGDHAQRGPGGAEQVAEHQARAADRAGPSGGRAGTTRPRRRAPAWSGRARRAARTRRSARPGSRRPRCRW